ncbi:MAG: metal-dependent hydrolase [Acidobacteriota bacterium]
MDNLTHSLVGLMLSRTGLDTWAAKRGEKGTAAMMMLAANAPDVDAYPFFTNQLDYLSVHRGYTHALAFVPLVALLPMAIMWAVTRKKPTLLAWFFCVLAILSHLVLDWTNVYGIRMLLPFSDRWLRLDITNVVDPVIWAILLLCMAVPAVLALVSREIGQKKTSGLRRGWAWAALLGLLAYEGLRWDSHERAVDGMNALLYMDRPAKHVYAFPDGLGLRSWRGVVEGDSFYYVMDVDRSGEFDLRNADLGYKAPVTPELDVARQTPVFQAFLRFNQVPFWRTSPLEDATEVQLLDLRFGGFDGSIFMATATVRRDGSAEAHFGR